MQQTTGVLDLATRAAARALASWQELTGTRAVSTPPPGRDEPAPATEERRAA
jgi:hypothetical protein